LPTTRGFETAFKRIKHFTKHGRILGYANENDYETAAITFFARVDYNIRNASRPRENDIIYYDYQTNEFGVLTAKGFIRTFFKPNTRIHNLPRNIDYFFAESLMAI
jgi:pyocin large subunit-like protein